MDRATEPYGVSTVTGIFIKSVLPDSPAGNSGLMNMGDRLLSVNFLLILMLHRSLKLLT